MHYVISETYFILLEESSMELQSELWRSVGRLYWNVQFLRNMSALLCCVG